MRRARIIPLSRVEAEAMRDRIAKMGHPTLYEMCNPDTVVFDLAWLHHLGAQYRIERTPA